MALKTIYRFKGVNGLWADEFGNFYFNNKPAHKVYNNGSLAVLCGRSKRGIIKLRKLAYKLQQEVDDSLPF
ncbi:MAG TPA: hypothetical protein PKN75_14975 [Bacteroidia bacterium]|nr:hypothetical protein [Bacteroidia bacterium]HNU34888.1 hypothetical protein [Bacteroidia bacterium]